MDNISGNISDTINSIILIILSLATLIGILDYIGVWPSKFRRFLRLNKADDVMKVLEEFGVDVKKYKMNNMVLNYPREANENSLKKSTSKSLEKFKINKSVSVGHHRKTELPYYYDIIGATCNYRNAEYFAQLLSTCLSIKIKKLNNKADIYFDFIVTPKNGSPILGYEFSKIMKKPLVLYESVKRFDPENDMRCKFDCEKIPDMNQTAILVDDSTTGGSMMCDAVDDLRKYNYNVKYCLVIFEPKSKDARERLKQKDVELISIIETHKTKKI